MGEILLDTPLEVERVKNLEVGDVIFLSGTIVTARDMAHLRIKEYLGDKKDLPIDLEGGVLFHAGPVVKKENASWDLSVIGPTTSIRMEPYAEMVGKLGVKGIIGKGGMGEKTSSVLREYPGIYLQAPPGCAVKLASGVEKIADVYWLDLGVPEAMWVMKVQRFGPLIVSMDSHGNSLHREVRESALQKLENMF